MFNFLVKNLEAVVDEYGEISSDKLVFSKELIESCKMNHCGKYNKSWMCPPALGNQANLLKKYQEKYNKVFVFTKIQKLSDPFDIEGMDQGRKAVEKILRDLINIIKGFDYQILGPGTCSICTECTYPEAECRFPHLANPSLEAIGINVMDLANLCSIKYYNGVNTVTYFAAIFYN